MQHIGRRVRLYVAGRSGLHMSARNSTVHEAECVLCVSVPVVFLSVGVAEVLVVWCGAWKSELGRPGSEEV